MSSRRLIARSAVGGDPAKEDPEPIVERTAQKLGVVRGAGEPNLLATKPLREHVADGLKRTPSDLPRSAVPIDELEPILVGELTLRDERLPARAEPAVDEDDGVALTELEDVEISRHAGEFDPSGGGECRFL